MITHASIIRDIIKHCDYSSYLELGIERGETFNFVCQVVDKSIGVDLVMKAKSERGTLLSMSTDGFFKQNKETFDAIFIDASHNIDFVKRDFLNSIKVLNRYGTIFLHDTDPAKKSF